jgi:hypothetical protein
LLGNNGFVVNNVDATLIAQAPRLAAVAIGVGAVVAQTDPIAARKDLMKQNNKHAKALIVNYRKFSQSVQPWQFGHPETKATCLWLKGLPRLTPTDIVEGREARVHREPPGPERWRNRNRTYPGIAEAMASQWGTA